MPARDLTFQLLKRADMPTLANSANALTEDQKFTPVEYGGLQAAYDHFNAELFDGLLPAVFITYQRKTNSRGYFSPERFSARAGSVGRDEVALNPDTFIGRSVASPSASATTPLR